VNAILALEDAEAQQLSTSLYQYFIALRRGRPIPFPPPVDDISALMTPDEQAMLDHTLSCTFVGSAQSVFPRLKQFVEEHAPDELMVAVPIHDHDKRLRSLEIMSQLRGKISS